MKTFPDEYYYPKNTSHTDPSDNPDLNQDGAIAGESKIVNENVQTLSNKNEKRKIIFNLHLKYWDQWRPTLLNYCLLLSHEKFELYGIGYKENFGEEKSLYPITGIYSDFIDILYPKLRNAPHSNEEIKKLFPDIKENETLIFEERHLTDLVDIDKERDRNNFLNFKYSWV